MKKIIVLAAFICVLGTGCDINVNNGSEKNENTSVSVSEELSSAVQNEAEEETEDEKEEIPEVTEADEKSEAPEVTEAPETTKAPEAEEETAAEKDNDLYDLKDYYLYNVIYDRSDYYYYLKDAGLNAEQVKVFSEVDLFGKFADRVISAMYEHSLKPEYTEGSRFMTGADYDSFIELVRMFFTEDGMYYDQRADEMWEAKSVGGELEIIGAEKIRASYENVHAEIIESSDNYVKFSIMGGFELDASMVDETYLENTSDITEAIRRWNDDTNYFGEVDKAEKNDDGNFLVYRSYVQEMEKTDDGWRVKSYTLR